MEELLVVQMVAALPTCGEQRGRVSVFAGQRRIEVLHALDLVQPHVVDVAGNITALQSDADIHALFAARVAKHLHAPAHAHDPGNAAAIAQVKNDVTMRRQLGDQRYQSPDIGLRGADAWSYLAHG
jgi:hypothetical protein